MLTAIIWYKLKTMLPRRMLSAAAVFLCLFLGCSVSAFAQGTKEESAFQTLVDEARSEIDEYSSETRFESKCQTKKMEEEVRALTKRFEGTWSVYFKRMDTREGFCLNATPMIAASTFKLYVYGAVLDQVKKGEAPAGYYDEDLMEMITYSSNEAWHYLTDEIGVDTISAFIDKNGFKHTCAAQYVPELDDKENFTDVADLGRLLEMVLDRKYVSKRSSDALLNFMKGQYFTHKIPSGLPKDIKTANKTGELEEMEHDAAVVFAPECTYILVIMTKDADPELVFDQYIELSHTIYEMVTGDKRPVRPWNYDELFGDDYYYDDYYYDDYYYDDWW